MNKVHILGFESLLYFIYRSTFITLSLPLLTSFKQDAILVCLIGSIIGFFLFTILLTILKKNTYDNIIIFIDKFFPKYISLFINISLLLIFILLGFLLFSRLIDFTHAQYLRDTPIIMIIFLFIGTILYLVSKDFETISKASLLLFMISFTFLLLKGLGLWNQVNIQNIMPLFKSHPNSILIGSLKYASITTLPLFLLLLVSNKNIIPNHNLYKKAKRFYLFTSILLFINMFFILTILGPNLLSIYTYPEFHLLKNVKILGFIDKIESILSISWILDMTICITLCFMYVKNGLLYYLKKLFPHLYNKINNRYKYYNE